eukprot:5747838-Alexandrium_andersonii.AAC.1
MQPTLPMLVSSRCWKTIGCFIAAVRSDSACSRNSYLSALPDYVWFRLARAMVGNKQPGSFK